MRKRGKEAGSKEEGSLAKGRRRRRERGTIQRCVLGRWGCALCFCFRQCSGCFRESQCKDGSSIILYFCKISSPTHYYTLDRRTRFSNSLYLVILGFFEQLLDPGRAISRRWCVHLPSCFCLLSSYFPFPSLSPHTIIDRFE